MYLYSHIWSTF